MIPARTSPQPAVASSGFANGLSLVRPSAAATTRVCALENDRAAEPRGRLARDLQPPRLDVGDGRLEQPRELARVRREHGVRRHALRLRRRTLASAFSASASMTTPRHVLAEIGQRAPR